MGYRSGVSFKTTSEGYAVMKKLNDSIPEKLERPLYGAQILRTLSGYYRIDFDWVKWYPDYPSVINFNEGLQRLDDLDIPYRFIRLGEETDDIEVIENYTSDMPKEIADFEVLVSINDGIGYEKVDNPDE